MKNGPNKKDAGYSFSIFYNNVVSFTRGNLEKLETHWLEELDFYFHIFGVTETKITNANQSIMSPHIHGYIFEHVPMF